MLSSNPANDFPWDSSRLCSSFFFFPRAGVNKKHTAPRLSQGEDNVCVLGRGTARKGVVIYFVFWGNAA